jgi:hypothetical protein
MCQNHTLECQNHIFECKNYTLRVKITLIRMKVMLMSVKQIILLRLRIKIVLNHNELHFTCQNHALRDKYPTIVCTSYILRVKIILVCIILSVHKSYWVLKSHISWKNHTFSCQNHTHECWNNHFLWHYFTLRIKITLLMVQIIFWVLKLHSTCQNQILACQNHTQRFGWNSWVSKLHFACWSHTFSSHNYT